MLHQRFIELGEGYGDVYELIELINTNKDRLLRTIILSTSTPTGEALSFAAAFKPAGESNFMPIYICREGIQQKGEEKPKRRLLFEEKAEQAGVTPVYIKTKHSSEFAAPILFYQYIIGVLRLNNLLPSLY
ncbi:methylthioribose kinase [Filibacter tadaridae]|uniref:DUF7147 domain-containing protein n=1 Tax=Filibacter tadaridae TaxID=2483811 RepID=A0A3P5XPU7_9BACL|nr:methylthioribose kinase [Filibacter tadaridae]VDC29865.1 hypothetical protein FILTAD_02417 [Filibacter tadaridae]